MSKSIDKALNVALILMVLLIIVVYFVGFSTDASTVIAGADSLSKTLTGRDAQGKFANYPQ